MGIRDPDINKIDGGNTGGNIANSNESSIQTTLEKINKDLYSNQDWDNCNPVIKNISLLQGIPFTIFSYAAGIFRSNNRYNLFGLIDLFTYVSRMNLLGSLNIRPDITFTFLNEKKILDGYISTYKNGLFGSALNIFMNQNDFQAMDGIIDKGSEKIIQENNNDNAYDVSYDLISKISINSLSSPEYFKEDICKNKLILDEEKLDKYKSIIYGGIDYEQIAVILNNLTTFPNIDDKGPDAFLLPKFIFHYYIDFNFDNINNIINIYNNPVTSSWIDSSNTFVYESSYNLSYYESLFNNLNKDDDDYYFRFNNEVLRERIYRGSNYDISLGYNDLFNYFFKNGNKKKCEYNYGQIYFFSNHKKIKNIYLPASMPEIFNSTEIENKFDKQLIEIYNYKYDENKMNSNEPKLSIILLPLKTTSNELNQGKIGTFTYQLPFEKYLRTININDSFVENYSFNSNYQFLRRNINSMNDEPKIFYTILCGFDDNLSYEYLEYLKYYNTNTSRTSNNITNIINKTYLCYYDGNNETFKKVLTRSNNTSTLDYFNNLKKILNYNSNNSFINTINNTSNVIDEITNFVYNINEGKAFDINIAKNNPLSYNSGLLLGIDCILLIYLSEIFNKNYDRIYKSSEIFESYHYLLTSNQDTLKESPEFLKLNEILNNRYYFNNENKIIDTTTNIIYNSIGDLSFNFKDEFFIKISQIIKRDILTLNQKTKYKILEFNNSKYVNSDGTLQSVDITNILLSDYDQIEDKWYDITYKFKNNIFNSFINNNENIYYNKIYDLIGNLDNVIQYLETTKLPGSQSTTIDDNTLYINASNLLNDESDSRYRFLININSYKNNISVYESYILLKTFNYYTMNSIEDFENTSQSYKLNNYIKEILKKYNALDKLLISDSYNEALIKAFNYTQDNYFLFNELKLYTVLIYKYENKEKALRLMVLFYKFQLQCFLSRDDYYKYVNDVIDNDISNNNSSSQFYNKQNFVRYIKLDESPLWDYKNLTYDLNNNPNILHSNCLNFTITDIFKFDLSYNINSSQLIDYNNYTLNKDFTHNQSKKYLELLLFLFKRNNAGLTHDLLEFFECLNELINDVENDFYIFSGENITNYGYFKCLLLCINSIFENLNTNLNDTNYENKFESLNDDERLLLFKNYKNFY